MNLIPVCAWCGKVRLPDGTWEHNPIATVPPEIATHGICPTCDKKLRLENDLPPRLEDNTKTMKKIIVTLFAALALSASASLTPPAPPSYCYQVIETVYIGSTNWQMVMRDTYQVSYTWDGVAHRWIQHTDLISQEPLSPPIIPE